MNEINIKEIKKKLKKQVRLHFNLLVKKIESFDRQKLVFYGFVAFSAIIIITAFKYSILEYSFYRNLAERQQTTVIKNPVSRGNIYSNNTPSGVLATSTDLSDLAIDPQEVGSKEKLENFLTDIVYEQLCKNKGDEDCIGNVLNFLKKTELSETDDISTDSIFLKSKIKEEVNLRVNKKYLDSVLIKTNLSQDEMNRINFLHIDGLYFVINNLYADPTKIMDEAKTSEEISKIITMEKSDIAEILKKRQVRYVKILTKLDLQLKDKVDERILNEKNAISKGLLTEENAIFKFIILDPHPTRFYPEKNLASQIIGFVNNNIEGRYGIEGYFNEELKGQEGLKTTKKDISGKAIGLDETPEKKLINGADIKLTIDRNVQKEVSKILEKGIKEFRANKGSVVIMDPKTGAITAMVNYPDFDPNDFSSVFELEKVSYAKYPNPGFDLLGMPLFVEDSTLGNDFIYNSKKIKLRQATENEASNPAIPKYKYKNNFGPGVYVNDTIGSLYEPGSVFKAFTTSIGIDTGDIKPSDMYTDRGFVEIDNFKISNVSKECIGYHPYSHALDWSCNVGMIDIIKKIGASLFYKYVLDFGFGQKTNITLEGEVFGKIDPYEKWSKAKLFTQSFGQGITATVLQMATAYSVLANGGIYMQPYIVDTITLPNGQVIKNSPTPLRRVIKEETSRQIIAMLTEGANIGFAKKGGVEGYDMAGKTGTSQIASKGKYEQGGAGHTITSYGGFGPSSNPKFVMIVKIDRPRSAEYSETTSSAIYSKIAKYLLNYYSIPKGS
ncbi:penicillin-binding protein 2 [Candidatus Gracilibacteria bacterium]|nr:penicillin-binding protein 2 [Candidatus Gracilibacteria bacterium]